MAMNLETMILKLKSRLLNSVVRGVIHLIRDGEGLQRAQLSLLGTDDVAENVERLQQYGFTSHPPRGSEALVLMVGGTRSHPVCVSAEDRRARKAAIATVESATGLSLQPGDVLLYTTHENFVLLRGASGNVIINSPGTIRLQARSIEFAAADRIKWDVSGRGYNYFPLLTDSYEQCALPGASYPCVPPEHPPAGAQ